MFAGKVNPFGTALPIDLGKQFKKRTGGKHVINADTTARAVQEVVNAQIIIEYMKQVMPTGNLCELALKLETRNLAGGLDSPFREMERDRVIREAGRIPPAITPFAPTEEKP